MSRLHRISITLLTAAAGLAASGRLAPVAAQDTAPDAQAVHTAQAALEACAAAGGSTAERKQAADDAEARHRALLRQQPQHPDLRVGLAQVLIRCQLPHASMSGIMSLLGEAESHLKGVLADHPDHWNAGFTLAMLLRNMPAMMGRGADAVQAFERLISLQGARADRPAYLVAFLQLGDLHEQAGRRVAAIEVWRRGLALFPDHVELSARLERAGVPAVPDTAWLAALRARSADAAVTSRQEPPSVHAFAPLRVEALNHQFQEARAGTTLRRLDVYTMPGGTGEMLQALQAMPGATRAGDGAELYIRGGDPAETPVFFDGGRLAFPGRWESMQGSAMGVVDASVLRRAYFSSGGFSARYGNALSGVVDVETEGRPARAVHRYGANMVQAGTTLRAPVGEHTGVWGTLSGTDTRLITRMNGESEFYTRAPQSVQGVAGVVFEPARGIELRSTVLGMADRFGRRFEMNGHNGSFESSSSMQHVSVGAQAVQPDGQRGVRASVTASRRTGAMRFGVLDREREDLAFGGRLDGDVVLSSAIRVRSGVELLRSEARSEGTVPLTPDLAPGSPSVVLPRAVESAWHTGAYAEAEHATASGLALVAGIRMDALPGESGVSVDPRLGAAWGSGEWTLRAGAGVFHQGSWRARYRLPDPGQPGGIPTRAAHLVAGVEKAGTLAMRAEAYLKRYDDYVPAGSGPAISGGMNSGIDAMARWSPRSGPSGWASWSLLRGRVDLDAGGTVPSALDVTHSITTVARLPLGDWELGTTARYATGKPFTPVVGYAAGAPVYGTIHGARLPDYRRLDARITRYLLGEGRTALVYLEMLNLLDRRNVMNYTYDDGGARLPVHSVFAHRTFVLGFELQFN
jgi:vitamin B12 transporter